jgi:hypothetical protein
LRTSPTPEVRLHATRSSQRKASHRRNAKGNARTANVIEFSYGSPRRGTGSYHRPSCADESDCLRAAAVICNRQRPGSRSALRGFEAHADGAARSSRETRTAIIVLDEVSACCDSDDAEGRGCCVRHRYALRRAGRVHHLCRKRQAGRSELYHRPYATERDNLRATAPVICNRQRPGSFSDLRGPKTHQDRAARSA